MSTDKRKSPRPANSRPAQRKQGPRRPPEVDAARQAAFDTLRAVRSKDAYANLVLPEMLRERRVTGRDAALATELAYGTARLSGMLDEIVAACSDRPPSAMDGDVLDALRIGTYQLLRTRIPPHAAVTSTVDLARLAAGSHVAGFVNAVLRRVSAAGEPEWVEQLAPARDTDPIGHLGMRTAHPGWIVRAFAEALGDTGTELEAALEANNVRPDVHLAARPGAISAEELAAITGSEVAPYSPYGVRLEPGGGDPAESGPISEGLAAVQDEGSQLCARAAAEYPLDGTDARWLDLCAGPGGKARVLGALAALSGAELDAVEPAEHRARMVRDAVLDLPVTVHVTDGRESGLRPGYDRVLVDAPCTGLGALRRRPEARWRRVPGDVAGLTRLQTELLSSAIDLVRPGGVVCYVVCSPHLAETEGVVADLLRKADAHRVDARPLFEGVPGLGDGPDVQLWPHRHGTDAMYCALLQKS
ncbi:16S rRNA (cytosine967-C5)-methyltransferase [Haloechinothrix alba]|uniref:16S rRNA (Cytosine967-C5)-methyltransferase n=1 Tax=Haloechinothrix alba TaxID=664784 RepID=A0A238WXN2_9PSEU|nr:transcription antitermination factor NusB [Haloechinothrix alba]SNR51287.1 16S rRNA (cytosine967-C5)-methyltransferase [Haloechinothrix alba]